jgi:hypothetical protein
MSESATPLPTIEEAGQLTDADGVCLDEIREVLRRHNAMSRFGVCLLHQHFDLTPDEVLVESCDEETRTLTTKPVLRSSVEGKSLETSWRLDIREPLGRCISYCEIEDGPSGRSHVRKHRATL